MSTENQIILTAAGFRKLEKELERLRTVSRREVADRIRESKQFGDLSENAEFEEAKIEQAFVEGRIRDLQRVMQVAHVVDPDEVPTDCVGIGSVVTVEDLSSGDVWELTLVGSVESDPANDRVSDESPVGQALFGRQVGDEVRVRTPDGSIGYRITGIRR
ncbi:MAG TPA: transcription elongation factor GreA [Chthonomonadales bacterium]|nr:transcription elongation factor GreA [Chthonomonadales bacterium]